MSDCCSAPGLMPFNDALENLVANVPMPSSSELVSIEECIDRVLACDVISPVFVPPHNNSAMDGYAFSSQGLMKGQQIEYQSFKVVGRSFAGEPFRGVTGKGECIRIMTGAKLPNCCDTVVMQENTKVDGQSVSLTKPALAKANVRYKGEDISLEDKVLNKGHKLTAIDMGMLASLGIKDVRVYTKLTVAVMSTGDELKTPGQALTEGDIFESNRYALLGLLKRMNVNILDLGIIVDNKKAIRDAFIYADANADVVISSGGVSVGEADYTKEILSEIGEIGFWKIAMKPGKPFAFGKLDNSIFFGLPGNPVSAIATFYLLATHGIEKMQGQPFKAPIQFKAVTQTALRKQPGRMDFQRAIYDYDQQGNAIVTSTGSQGSGILSSISKANCFIVLAAEQGSVSAKEQVVVQPFNHLF